MMMINCTIAFQSSLNFVKKYCKKYNIDKSHNEHHSKEVLYWALDTMKNMNTTFRKTELNVISEACILHDMVDSKYRGADGEHVHNFLKQKYNTEETDAVMNIINTMSYSKIMKQDRVVFPEWIDHSPYKRAFHIVREGDLLSSYNIARMIEYRIAQNMPINMIKKEIPIFYHKRMAKLVDQGHFVHDPSRERAKQLDSIAQLKLDAVYSHDFRDLDYFTFVDYIDPVDLEFKFKQLIK
jgi:HD superfamily phosphodiesterase